MIYAIALILLGIAGWGLIYQDQQIKKLKARVFNQDGDPILNIVQGSEEISYYRDYYTQDGTKYAMHALGAKGWTFQQCQDYGLTITDIREHQFDVGRDILRYMIPAYALSLAAYREKQEDAALDNAEDIVGHAHIFVEGTDAFKGLPCTCEIKHGTYWDADHEVARCKYCDGVVTK